MADHYLETLPRKIYAHLFLAVITALLLACPFRADAARFAYITNTVSNSVTVIDTTTDTIVPSTITIPNPFAVAVHPDATRVYVTSGGSIGGTGNGIWMIKTDTNSPTEILTTSLNPRGIAINPDGSQAYVTAEDNNGNGFLLIIDVDASSRTKNQILRQVSVGHAPFGVAASSDTIHVYVANTGDDTLSVINVVTFNLEGKIDLHADPSSGATACSPVGVAVTPDGSRVYVTNGNTCIAPPNTPNGTVWAIDALGQSKIGPPIVLDGRLPKGIAIDPAGSLVYVVNGDLGPFSSNGAVSVISTQTNQLVSVPISVGTDPFGIAVHPDGTRVYVANENGLFPHTTPDTVSIISGGSSTLLQVGQQPVAFGQFISCPASGPKTPITPVSQCTTPWGSQTYDLSQKSICSKGCALTSFSMDLNFAHVPNVPSSQGPVVNDPLNLNAFLNDNSGYDKNHGVRWGAATNTLANLLSKKLRFDTLGFIDSLPTNLNFTDQGSIVSQFNGVGLAVAQRGLDRALCQGQPIIVGVKITLDKKTSKSGKVIYRRYPGHFVLVTGRQETSQGVKYIINDPATGTSTSLDSYNYYIDRITDPTCTDCTVSLDQPVFETRGFVRDPLGDVSSLNFTSDNVDILITDANGNRTGFDVTTGQQPQDIPASGHFIDALHDDVTGEFATETTQSVLINQAASGTYQVDVIGLNETPYTVSIQGFSQDGSPQPPISIPGTTSLGAVSTFFIQYAFDPGAVMDITGSFDGGGQRPRDVNKFLSYSNPTTAKTALPAGTTSFPLQIVYGKTVIPASFSATLNGTDVSSLFSPVPASVQVVNISLQSGTNVLNLSINGNLTSRIATDTDKLEFDVP